MARIKDAVPKPISNNPEFISIRLNDSLADYEGMTRNGRKRLLMKSKRNKSRISIINGSPFSVTERRTIIGSEGIPPKEVE